MSVNYLNPEGLHKNPAFSHVVTVEGSHRTIYGGWPERGGRCRRDTTYYVEDGDQGAEWRRLVYRIVSENAYEELMYRESADGWDQLAEFKFQRDAN